MLGDRLLRNSPQKLCHKQELDQKQTREGTPLKGQREIYMFVFLRLKSEESKICKQRKEVRERWVIVKTLVLNNICDTQKVFPGKKKSTKFTQKKSSLWVCGTSRSYQSSLTDIRSH